MSFKIVEVLLSADVAASGTLTLPYPSGSVQADFDALDAHLASISGANLTIANSDFSLVFNSSDITFTNGASNFILPAKAILQVQLVELGGTATTFDSITGSDSSLAITGKAGATSVGGAVPIAGGAGDGANAGGPVSVTGGAGGATSGVGGAAQVTGGAGTNGDANGGNAVVTAGAKDGTGLDGMLRLDPLSLPLLVNTPAPTTTTTGTTWSAADMTGSPIHEKTPTAAQNFTTATGAELSAIFPSVVVGDAFQIALLNLGGDDDDVTILAGASGMTLVGKMIIASINDASNTYEGSALFQCRNTGSDAWTLTRIG